MFDVKNTFSLLYNMTPIFVVVNDPKCELLLPWKYEHLIPIMRGQCVDVEVWSLFGTSYKEKLSLFHPSQGGYLHGTFPEGEQFLNKGAYKSGFLKL